MPIDASIPLGVKPLQLEDPLNAMSRVLQMQGAQSQNDLAQYSISKARRQDDETNRLAQLLSGGGVDLSTPEGQSRAYTVAPTVAGQFIKNQLDQRETVSKIGKNDAEAGQKNVDAEHKVISIYRDAVNGVNDPKSAVDFVTSMHTDPRLKNSAIARVPLDQAIAQIPTDPAQLADWKQKFALGATKFMELNKPNVQVRNTGGSTDVLSIPGMGGAASVVSSVPNTQSPDNRATIAGENVRAGINPDGTPTGDMETTAQAIANGQLPPPSGMALTNPKNQRILARVFEINPKYDFSDVTAKRAAATAFTSGPLGNALRSVSTANQHLDQLGQLGEALKNGDVQLANKVYNWFSTQTGNPQVTNFDAVKNIVGQEVVKAIVANGGSQQEREAAAQVFSNAKSPEQLAGAVQNMRMLMGAQEQNLLAQRRAAGLRDETLPQYHGSANAQSAPKIKSKAEYDKLPSGALFMAPDGTTRSKP